MSLGAVVEITNLLATALATIATGAKITLGRIDNKNVENPKDVESQEIDLQLMQAQARVAQEIAIAKRIEIADEVEIEEFYEGRGEGNAGAQLRDGSVNLGISGSGNKVTKRVYRFRGFNKTVEVEQTQD